jgi:hypothetical protein
MWQRTAPPFMVSRFADMPEPGRDNDRVSARRWFLLDG